MKSILAIIAALALLLLGIVALSNGIIFGLKQVVIICAVSFLIGMITGGYLAFRFLKKREKPAAAN